MLASLTREIYNKCAIQQCIIHEIRFDAWNSKYGNEKKTTCKSNVREEEKERNIRIEGERKNVWI